MRRWPALVVVLLGLAAVAAAGEVRPPAVAGSFYPKEAGSLRAEVEALLERAGPADGAATARAVVVPHAGYVFSGPTAALAFARLPADGIRRVILLGPSHHLSFSGGALPDEELTAFATPLGAMALDTEALGRLRDRPGFDGPPRAHAPEHSLEVEIPFLQVIAPDARLVPIAIGGATGLDGCTAIAEALAALLDDSTVVVASSDFTHHGRRYGWAPYDGPDLPATLLAVGRATADRVAAGDPRGLYRQVEVSGDTVCGVAPMTVLASLVEHAFAGDGRVLEVTTSGHITGSFDLSVTYASVAFSGSWTEWRPLAPVPTGELDDRQGAALVELARAALLTRLSHDAGLAGWFAEHADDRRLVSPAGAFVTLNRIGVDDGEPGRLRACMGVVEATQPAVDAVVQAAVWATRDPRFPPLELGELEDVVVEVSVLSAMREVGSYRDIEVGIHGVLLSRNGSRAVFLPQVATEQGWSRRTMLEHLAVKAGLDPDGWRDGARFEVFTAQIFREQP
jgi:AmmeMemoRadiSam system protein B/AmmeMemoRadiSam system protein A